MEPLNPKDRIVVALDVPDAFQAQIIATKLAPHVGVIKIGLEQIMAGCAFDIAESVRSAGGKVFLDGKLCDIPNTVGAASRQLTLRGVTMFNLHTTCGEAAMQAAVAASRSAWKETSFTGMPPKVLGVTLLTSLDAAALNGLGIFGRLEVLEHVFNLPKKAVFQPYELSEDDIGEIVVRLAAVAQKNGLDGVVASPLEVRAIREACGPDFLIVTPGVRPKGAAVGDQKRIMTPYDAIKAGADYLVIGRPILQPESGTIEDAAKRIADEIASAL